MNRQRNASQNKEQDNIPSRELNQAEISNMPARVMKATVKNSLYLRKEWRTEDPQPGGRKQEPKMKTLIPEIKNALDA